MKHPHILAYYCPVKEYPYMPDIRNADVYESIYLSHTHNLYSSTYTLHIRIHLLSFTVRYIDVIYIIINYFLTNHDAISYFQEHDSDAVTCIHRQPFTSYS